MASLLNRATLLSLIAKEGKGAVVNPSALKHKYGLPESLAMASRFIDYGSQGFLKRGKGTGIKSVTGGVVPTAFWILTAKGEKFLKDHADEIKPVEQLKREVAAFQEAGGRGGSKGNKNQGIALNKKANTAIDSISQLIEDYNKSHTVLKEIHRLISGYLKDNRPETLEE